MATWNLDWWRKNPRETSPWELIEGVGAEVFALQEVAGRDIHAIRASHDGGCLFSQEVYAPADPHRWMGCGLLLPVGAHTLEVGVIEDLPKPQRVLWARVDLPDHGTVTYVSWHSPNAAKDGRATKMQGYRAMTEWLIDAPHPLVLAADLNTWSDLADPEEADPADEWYEELDFVGAAPRHGLVDAYRALLERRGELEARREEKTDEPLAVSYVLSDGAPHRMDRIYVSPDFAALDGAYGSLDEAMSAGSDHAVHWVDLESEEA